MDKLTQFFENFITPFSMLRIDIMDIIEILLIAMLIYNLVKWVKNTKAWVIIKGLAVLFIIYIVVYILDFEALLWIFSNTIGIGITAIIIVFQPELRKALEQLGKKNLVSPLLSSAGDKNVLFSDNTMEELVKASYELGKTRTGALIVIERDIKLDDYVETGIGLDAVITSQLLINIFEHNTPLHDGAVIVRGDRIVAATCYLPLSDNMNLSKELGTRHRAAVGISEAADCFTIVVSEETGGVSCSVGGELSRSISREKLYQRLREIQKKEEAVENKKRFRLRSRAKN